MGPHEAYAREALINGSAYYLNEVNRERDRYLAGLIDAEEFEQRVEVLLRRRPPRDMANRQRY